MRPVTVTDPTTWPPLSGLEPGFDANKAPVTTALAGRQVALVDDHGHRAVHTFDTTTVGSAEGHRPGSPPTPGDPYEAFEVDAGLYFVCVQRRSHPGEALSVVLDVANGRALSVLSVLGTGTRGHPAVSQTFVPWTIEGTAGSAAAAPAPTTALLGRRVLWVYSAEHAYEHVYLSPRWYTWHCLAGPERGLADTDRCDTWQLRPGVHVFAWREKVIPCAAVTVADHRGPDALRSHGVLFGADDSGTGTTSFTFGAHGRLLSLTSYPPGYDPATEASDG